MEYHFIHANRTTAYDGIDFKKKWMVSVVVGLFLSATIEILQLVSHRGLFEFDDIFHNTLGTAVGVVLFLLVSSVIDTLKRKRED